MPGLLALCERHDACCCWTTRMASACWGRRAAAALAHFGLTASTPRRACSTWPRWARRPAWPAPSWPATTRWSNGCCRRRRSYIFATAAPPLLASALRASLRLIEQRRAGGASTCAASSRGCAHGLAEVLRGTPWQLGDSATAIQPLVIGANDEALAVMEGLRERGLWVPAIRPPTVPEGTARLRIALSAAHTEADVDRLIRALAELAADGNPLEETPCPQRFEQPVTLHRPAAARRASPAPSAGAWKPSQALFDLPFPELLFRAQTVHREHFDPTLVELATLLSIKTGGCPEDCGYCPQAARYDTGVEATKLMEPDEVLRRRARGQGRRRHALLHGRRLARARRTATSRRSPSWCATVKALGLETCATLGMLEDGQAERCKDAGLDYYNHNLDTAPEFYGDIITTREYQDRLDTLGRVRDAGMKVCCGGIVGMGESRRSAPA